MTDVSAERTNRALSLEEVPPIPMIACVLCAAPVDATARICNACKGYQIGKGCVVCGKWIPGRAAECPECKSPQNAWRRILSIDATVLALLISLISVVSSVGPGIIRMIHHGSETSGYVVGTERDANISKQKDVIVVRALNSGGQVSIVQSASVDLTKAGGGIVPVQITGERHIQPNGGTADLRLFAADDRFKVAEDKRETVVASLCKQPATIELKVDERSFLGGTKAGRPLSIPIDAQTVRAWAAQRLVPNTEACP